MRLSYIQVSLLLWVGSLSACGQSAPELRNFEIVYRAQSDMGDPVGEVHIFRAERHLGATDKHGELRVKVAGHEGENVTFTVQCPTSFATDEPQRVVRLRTVRALEAQQAAPLLLRLKCTPNYRTAAVVVRAPGQAGLPIVQDGQVVGTTNAQGAATLTFKTRPESTIRLALDTSNSPRLRPQNPPFAFHVGDRDELFVIDQNFEEERMIARRSGLRRARSRMEHRPRAEAAPFRRPERIN